MIVISKNKTMNNMVSEGSLMKDELAKTIKKAHLISMAKYLLKTGVIDTGTYNILLKKIS